ncbi:MAG: helix-hairpin-helix domain-containing protein [Spirochaetota bacterium]
MKKLKDKTDLQSIPGIGPSMKKDLVDLGIDLVPDLKGKNPEKLYNDLCKIRNTHIDRCVLYVFRCAVYYAENEIRDPELIKWWNWKDR